ncbi:MAG TPA: aminotransferase class V-fold PLP-dependent enzyme, partial [Membranihabitans sp.]|nr:aminotransferase class V-fold PLP-dependent enzyme [Membranihabitans sp.]
FLAFSSHKIFGPTGMGILYGKEKWLDHMPPYQGGGEMIATVTFPKTTFNKLPFKFEAGTPHIAGAIGLNAALEYVQNVGLELIEEYEKELLDYALSQLADIDGLRLIGEAEQRSGAISFLLDGIHPFDTGEILDKLGIAVRTGHHCTEPIMDYFGIPGTVRASFTFYNNKSDVDRLKEGILRAQKMLK